jgi:hypothetical protein
MNRAERRAAGFRGPAYTMSGGDKTPRFVRRKMAKVLDYISADRPMTRRVRKDSSRIGRHARRLGLA